MISSFGFGGAFILVVCAIANYINIPFAPAAWIASIVGAVFCAIVGVVYLGRK